MQNIDLICVGKLNAKYFAEGVAEYQKRLSAFASFRIVELPEEKIEEKNKKNKKKSEDKNMLEKVKETVAEALGADIDTITAETSFKEDLGADSLDVFQIIMGIEEEFDIEIPNEEAEKIVSVGDAVEAIKNAVDA